MVDMFDCQEFDGDLRLMTDLQVICWKGMHLQMSIYIAFPCLFMWGLGIPAGTFVLMRREKDRLDTVAAKEKFGFLYNGYKRKAFYWEIVIMYRKIACIFIAVFMNRIGLVVQALVLLLLLVTFLQINNLMRPFAARALNDIESISLITSIITIYCGLFFIASKDKNSESFNPNEDFYLDETGKLFFFLIILICNALFLLMWIFKFFFIMRSMIKERQPKIYVMLFLCCRKDKLEKEDALLAKEAKRETIIEKIEEIQFFMKEMKRVYERQVCYEGHQQFMKMLYFLEAEKGQIDMTEKKNNFYIQGKIARERKFDPAKREKILDPMILEVEDNFEIKGPKGGKSIGDLSIKRGSIDSESNPSSFIKLLGNLRNNKVQSSMGYHQKSFDLS